MTDLKTIRTNLQVSLKDVGDNTGVSKQYVSDMENGRRPMSDNFKDNLLKWLKDKKKKIDKIIKKLENSA